MSGTNNKEEYFIFENVGEYVVVSYNDSSNSWVKDDSLKKYVLKRIKDKKEITAEEFSKDFNTIHRISFI